MQYHGGTNFDRLASAFIITAYYDEAPLDEYGMVFYFLYLIKLQILNHCYVTDYANVTRFG